MSIQMYLPAAGGLFRFASIAKMAGEQMEPYVAQLVPKLYRYAALSTGSPA